MGSCFLHESLTRSLLREMASGTFRDGQKFYSMRKIGRQWKVSEPTVANSLWWLETRELLRASPRRGYFLTTGFQQRAQLLLRKTQAPELATPSSLAERARSLRGAQPGGRIALLLEADAGTLEAAGQREHAALPQELAGTVARCAQAFAEECREAGQQVRFFLYGKARLDGGRRNWIRGRLEGGGFAGAAVFCRSSHRVIRPLLEPMTRGRLPVIILYDDCQGLPIHSINLNNTGIGYDAVRYFRRMGHRKIAVLSPRSSEKHHRDRVRGCLLAATEGGDGKVTLTVLKPGTGGAGKTMQPAVRRHFASKATRPTAVFVTWSRLLPSMESLWRTLGLAVPGDLSVIVCSSNGKALGKVALDTMHLDLGARVGRMAARQLRRIQAGEALEKSTLLNVVHRKRGSVARREP